MVTRVPLNRQVPADELEKFVSFCEERAQNAHEIASQAVLEYLPAEFVPEGYGTDRHVLEQQVRADVAALDLLADSSLKKTGIDENALESLRGAPTRPCRLHIDEDLVNALEEFVGETEGKQRGVVGVYFARALAERRDGGQVGRIRNLYSRLRDNADILPEDRETRTDRIAERVREKVEAGTDEYVHERTVDVVIREETDAESDAALREYRAKVFDRLGLVEVETSDGVFAPPEIADEMAANHATDELTQQQYESLDRSGRVEHVRAAIKSRAEQRDGRAKLDYKQVINTVFAGVDGPSHDYAYTLMEEAAGVDGFRYGEYNGQKVLRFNQLWIGETSTNANAEGGVQTAETTTQDSDSDEQPDESSGDEWVPDVFEMFSEDAETVADEFPDVAIRSKIARFRHGENEGGYAKNIDEVPDSDINAVQKFAKSLAEESDTADDTDTSDETEEQAEPESDEETAVSERLDTISHGVPANAQVATDGGDDSQSGDDRRQRPMTDGGTVSVLESRSLEPDPCCPRCGGRLRETEQDLTVECTRVRCGRRVSLTDVVDTGDNITTDAAEARGSDSRDADTPTGDEDVEQVNDEIDDLLETT